MDLKVINIIKWINENQDKFFPPVCNHIMHNDQLIVMYIGGPNMRDDYHIEEGEEFFYMVKGEMVLKIVEKGKRKDVRIKEGECFVLPARIPHSPQRSSDTIGLVIERKRHKDEFDVLRYYINGSVFPLYEKSFYCEDLGVQLKPIIEEYFASEEKKSGTPSVKSVLKELPFKINDEDQVEEPFNLSERLKRVSNGESLIKSQSQFKIDAFVDGSSKEQTLGDCWIWQIDGTSQIEIDEKVFTLNSSDSFLVPKNSLYYWKRSKGTKCVRIQQFK